MPTPRSEHRNALIKLVKQKRMILQADATKRLNKKNINHTVVTLVEQGQIKRQKVKVRGSVGNLTDQYLLYSNDVKQNEILDYEKVLINRTFESPLVKNHCYKKIADPVEQELKPISKVTESDLASNNNVIDMQDYVKINNTDLKIKEYCGERVVTIKEIASIHNKPIKAVNQQLERNKNKFIEDVDYFVITKENLKVTASDFEYLFTSNRQKEVYLITEMGYLMLVKSFKDDLSWEVQRQLVQSYFKVKEIKQLKESQNNSLPIIQQDINFNGIYDIMKLFAGGITDLNDRVKTLENTIEGFKKAIS